ncbi:endonuclease, partial [Rhizobiaceae sp. 2RAB30]
MKLVSYNIQYGMGPDGIFDPDRISASVAGADIIALQEVSRGLAQNGGADLVALLEERLPGYFSAYAAAMDIDGGSSIVD